MSLSRLTYGLLLRLMLPFAFVRLAVKGLRQRGYWRGWGQRLGFAPHHEDVLWIHAVSVGEVRAAAALVRALHETHPDRRLLVTTTTPTGADQARALLGHLASHTYLPYDSPSAVERFLTRTRPLALLVMETEIWPVLYERCARRGIPVCLLNARLSMRSFRRYQWIPRLIRQTLGHVDLIAAQTEADAGRLIHLGAGASHVHVAGNLKFDLVLPEGIAQAGARLRACFQGAGPVWIAASTHEGEEEIVLKAHLALRARYPDLGLILAPRHPERAPALARLCARHDLNPVSRSHGTNQVIERARSVLLADTLGELPLLLAAAKVAFMGGSLVPVGGHNLLEPCALGVPVVFGPHMFNFAEIARLVNERGAGRQISGPAPLADMLEYYLANPSACDHAAKAGRALIHDHRGAVARTLALLEPLITPSRALS
ncbi:MAG: lipid IV(A) 3-deoxy-D-manno-octulosonic acid transferase [Acidiferrobacteraceae bacterium]